MPKMDRRSAERLEEWSNAFWDEVDPPKCYECGSKGHYMDGICYQCAAQPFGFLWQMEQNGYY